MIFGAATDTVKYKTSGSLIHIEMDFWVGIDGQQSSIRTGNSKEWRDQSGLYFRCLFYTLDGYR